MTKNLLRSLTPKVPVKLPVQLKNEFYAACTLEGMTMQDVLYRFVVSYTDSKRDRLSILDGSFRNKK